MQPIEKLKAEIAGLEKQQADILSRQSTDTVADPEGDVDPYVEQASEHFDTLTEQIEAKRRELKELGGDPFEGFVGASPADE